MQSQTSAFSTDTSLSLNTEYRGPLIPPSHDRSYRHRTIVLCFDGTGDQFDLDNSNVVQFFSVLKKGDRKRQLVYYQSGIGTYSIPQVATPLYSKLSKTLDLMFASNLRHHVMSGYNFLMQNYKEGDKICIFGFSRGAYTARALAGMVHKVGLLPAGNEQQVPFAYKMYQNDTEMGWQQSVAFKKAFSMDVDIEFVGVWDTVASVGLFPTTLPFTKSNTAIKVFRHALSLDEHRTKFKPSIYQKITEQEAQRGDFVPPSNRRASTMTRGRRKDKRKEVIAVKEVKKEGTDPQEEREQKADVKTEPDDAASGGKVTTHATKVIRTSTEGSRSESGSRSRAILGSIKRSARGVSEGIQEVVERVSLDRDRSKSKNGEDEKEDLSPDSERDQLEQMYLDRSRRTDVLEVWFAGCHCDVGGGSVPNTTPNNLARIPLRWMIRECFLARTGIQFEADRLRDLGLDPVTLYPRVSQPTHPDSLDDPGPLEIPQPGPLPPLLPDIPPLLDNDPLKADQKQEVVVGMEVTQDTSKKVEEAKTGNTTSVSCDPPPVSAPSMSTDHERQHNVSMDGTLVNFDSDSEEAPKVQVERASVNEEKLSTISDEHQALNNVPQVGQVPPKQNLRPDPVPLVAPKSTKPNFTVFEMRHDALDARSEEYDQLKIAKYWWILEFIPFRERVQLKDGTFKKKWCINRGRPRVIPQEEPLNVHRSVKLRMEAKDLKYKPRVKFDKEPNWVD
ncbi:uncharacterized protein FOMMEDRAFT_103603 [Fomitiporia mediterranea MF3/22]|uniref:uncharacterized protein n=1 Tax=Fomitiporia mediterranea (strain MF3/22) TaxID=694068 RepID=UPI0004408B8C|nr:uncharacterized protein FOMMEDRAFT_103603 [Fomitiporia mediterranea MF3/22]EJD05526.1 hypothetical protein FOMMEDRAFT_103603 [Fomitiporia mediterranea MF3/22]